MLQTFLSVSIRRVIAMTENIQIGIVYHSVPDGGMTMSYQFIPWAAASVEGFRLPAGKRKPFILRICAPCFQVSP